ncbi:cholinesterase-like [Liolophura sinensis]|uniref:cholinesterase-like n=1 Tax=Liolophura sinensis TaxID=3198878 RepID=UPI003158A5E5
MVLLRSSLPQGSLLSSLLWILLVTTVKCENIVHAPVGSIRGTSDNAFMVRTFLGIPYAKPPVKDLRFRKPEIRAPFQGTYNATEYGQPCTQGNTGAEDCLFLNVFVPANTSSEDPVPVMVWIHGGAFQFDTASNYDGISIAGQGGVIFVTMNYRLGVLGFLNTQDSSCPGNYGLWDQLLALQWVKRNINAFGGDPEKITLIGESAGAASAAYHALSPHSSRLFQRLILQSGTAISPFALNRNPRQDAMEFAKRLDCDTPGKEDDASAMMDCLRSKNVTDIFKSSHRMPKSLGMSVIDFTWVPSVDADFVPDDPNSLITNGTYLQEIGFFDADLLLGMNNDEGSLVSILAELVQRQNGITFQQNGGVSRGFYEEEFIPAIVRQKFGNTTKEGNQAVRFTYEPRSDGNIVPNADWFQAYADATFLSAITRHALAHASSHGRTFLYLFDHSPSYINNPVITGTPHGGDVPYLFGFSRTADANLTYTQEELGLSMNVVTYWSNMAKSGTPNLPETTVPVQWPQFDQQEQKFLKLSTALSNNSIGQGLFVKRAEFWLDFMPTILLNEPQMESSTYQPPTEKKENGDSSQSQPAQFIKRFNIGASTAEGTIIALAVVVAVLLATITIVVLYLVIIRRRKNYSVD